jgi:hypothetical protein
MPEPKLEEGRNATAAPMMITDKIARPLLDLKQYPVFMVPFGFWL